MTLTWGLAGSLPEWTRGFWECVWVRNASSPYHLSWAMERMEMVRVILYANIICTCKISITASSYLILQEVTSPVKPLWCLMWFCWTFITLKMKSQYRWKTFQILVHGRVKSETSCVIIITDPCWTAHSLTPGKNPRNCFLK